jgi:hypothetical protein
LRFCPAVIGRNVLGPGRPFGISGGRPIAYARAVEGLLDENQVVDAVAAFLASDGYTIEQKLHGHQRGVDLIARRTEGPVRLIHVEAKGGTSTRVGSAKYGKPMSGGEVRINVAEALYTAAVVSTRDRTPDERGLVPAVAFHDDARHRSTLIHFAMRSTGSASASSGSIHRDPWPSMRRGVSNDARRPNG